MPAGTPVRADWVLPITSRPLPGGHIVVANGRIVSVQGSGDSARDLGRVALLPGLVNAHTHLELSWLRGQVARSPSLVEWVRDLLRRRQEPPAEESVARSIVRAVTEARQSGTVLFGDVANTDATVRALGRTDAYARVFLELIGFSTEDPSGLVRDARRMAAEATTPGGRVRVSLAAHAPYSVAPDLFREIRADLDHAADPVSAVHVAESPEEVEFLATGRGAWRTLLEELGAWTEDWEAPGVSPVAYLERLGFLDRRVLAVHGVQCTGEDLRRLAALGVSLVACPRSNQHVGVGAPPLESFYAANVDVAFGTDSLASVGTVNLFDELAEARRLAPRVPANALLRSATFVGARALGFDADFGSLEPGRRADVLVVRVPEGVKDVEEYLVSGIAPDAVSWLQT